MLYTALEIVFILVVAAFLGLVLGWLLRGKSIRERLESQWRRLLDDERNNLRQANEQLKRVRAENETLAESAKGLQAKLDKLDSLPGENRKLQQQLEEARGKVSKLEPLTSQHAELSAQHEALQAQVDKLAPLQAKNAELTTNLDALQTQLSERESVHSENADLKATIEALRGRIDALEPLQGEIAGLTDQLESAQAELDELRPLSAEAQQLRDAVESLEKSLAQAEARTSVGGGTPAPPPEQAPILESQGAQSADDLHARIKQIAERTSGGEPAANDDLKHIRGVGPVIEKMLKEMGITSYRQIANFTKEDIDQVTAAMGSFRGRIQRDGWIDGAREEHRKKYGADA
jgi:predicted flap endonuclease-1-like 5' DNA nuclease